MRLWLLAGIAALCVGYFDLLPFESVDAGELYIVETLLVEQDIWGVNLYADEVQGCGATMTEALADMEEWAPGQVFLRQTKRIIFCGGTEARPGELPEDLPMGAGVYETTQSAEILLEINDLEDILEARERRQKQMPTLADLKNSALSGKKLPLAALGEKLYES